MPACEIPSKLSFHESTASTVEVASAGRYTAAIDADHEAYLDRICAKDPVRQLSLATDGITRDRLVTQPVTTLHPGYREDLLMVFPTAGTYCIVDGEASDTETVSAESRSRRLLGFVEVGPGDGTADPDPSVVVARFLIESAERHMPPDMRGEIVAALRRNLGIPAFVPHRSLMSAELDGHQTLGFRIQPPAFQIGELDKDGNIVNARGYAPGRIDRDLMLGAVEEWELRSFSGGHPFHIHVNPFQIVRVLDHERKDVSGYEDGNTSPYARLKGTWKDTLFITEEQIDEHTSRPYEVYVRTQYRRYIGDFVLHCHILDHEDLGMMQNVRISLPDGMGGLAASHH